MKNILSLSYIMQLIFLFFAYFFTGKLGLALGSLSDCVSLFWLPAGISLAAIITGGYRLWPGIFLGSFLVYTTQGVPLFSTFGIAVGNTLGTLTAVYLLNRFIHFRPSLERTHDILGLVLLAAPADALISATIRVLSLLAEEIIPLTDLFVLWATGIFAHFISNTLITPFLLIWGTYFSLPKNQ